MYLMDSVARTAAMAIKHRLAKHPVMGVYCNLHSRMTGVPRFLLDHNAIAAAVELSLGRPKIILEALQHLRLPYEAMWVEWEEIGREKLRESVHDHLGLAREVPGRPIPARLGFLVEADGTGRKGTATWLWSFKPRTADRAMRRLIEDDDPCEIGFVSPYFDFDKVTPQPTNLIKMFLDGNIAKLWTGNQVQQDALVRIWQTAEHKVSNLGETYLGHVAAKEKYTTERLVSIIENSFADVYGEYISLLCVLLLLTSARPIVEYRPVDRSKLNKARLRRKETPLLDHTQVVLHIGGGKDVRPVERRGELGYLRKSPRIHMVSSYLARRGDKHWVTRPYWRGQGEVVDRHVHVRK